MINNQAEIPETKKKDFVCKSQLAQGIRKLKK